MQCRNHPTIAGINTCNHCGSWLCENCTFERGGRIFCPSCAAQQATEHGPAPSDDSVARRTPRRYISWGVLFFFSICFPPGVNYMYMGLIKRGLAAMVAFFAVIYMTAIFSGSGFGPLGAMFGLAIPVLILAVAFDSFQIRLRINAGEPVNDDIEAVLAFVSRNRRTLLVIVAIIIALSVIGPYMAWFPRFMGRIFPILVIVWVFNVLLKKRDRAKSADEQD